MIDRLQSLRAGSTNRGVLATVAAGLAGLAALVYFVIAAGLAPGDVTSPPAPIMFAAGGAYLVGGGLILLLRRRLLILGAVLNPLVMVAFMVSFLTGGAELEPLSLVSKLAQVGLELALLLLIAQTAEGRIV